VITAHLEPAEEKGNHPRLVLVCTDDDVAITYTPGRMEVCLYLIGSEADSIRRALDGFPQ